MKLWFVNCREAPSKGERKAWLWRFLAVADTAEDAIAKVIERESCARGLEASDCSAEPCEHETIGIGSRRVDMSDTSWRTY